MSDEQPILRVERPYIPTIDIFGNLYSLRHPLQTSAQNRKTIGEIGARYLKLVGIPSDQIDEQTQRTMRDDMGKLIALFIPGLPSEDLQMLDMGDRFRIVGACFAAYDEVVAQQQARNVVDDDLSDEQREAMRATLARTEAQP